VPWRELEREMLHDRRQHQRRFLQGKGRTNARAQASAEWQIGKAIDLPTRLSEEAGRIEIIGAGPQSSMTMKHIGCNHHHRPSFNSSPREFVRTKCHPADCSDRRIKANSFLDDCPSDHRTFGQPSNRPADLGIIVGTVIVAITLYSSTKDHLDEFATLRAMGSSSIYTHKVIVCQAIVSALIGFSLAACIGLIIAKATAGTALPIVMTPAVTLDLFRLPS
jgi:hypothetical protein